MIEKLWELKTWDEKRISWDGTEGIVKSDSKLL